MVASINARRTSHHSTSIPSFRGSSGVRPLCPRTTPSAIIMNSFEERNRSARFWQELLSDRARLAEQFASRPPPFRRPLVFHCSAPRGSSSQIFENGRKCWRGLIPSAPKGIRGPLPRPARGHKPVAGRAPPQMGPQRFAGPRAAFPRSCRKERRSPGLPPTIL